jgi:hypothetical protein
MPQRKLEVAPADAAASLYRLLREEVSRADEWAIELALLDEFAEDLQNAATSGESDELVERAQEAMDALGSLAEAIAALARVPDGERPS